MNEMILPNESRISALDGFRGLCILWVLVHNLYPYGSGLHNALESSIRLIANMGWAGVEWFFVLSGFLITSILLKLKNVKGGMKIFYIRRALRIFPIYYLTLILCILALPLLGYVTPHTQNLIDHQAWYWLYVNNWMAVFNVIDDGLPHLWSLAVEEQFYCVWPWLILWLPRRWMIYVCMVLVVSAPLFRYLLVEFNPDLMHELAYKLTIVRWDALAMGALLAFAIENDTYKSTAQKWIDTYGGWIVLCLIIILFGEFLRERSVASVGSNFLNLNQTLMALFGVVIVVECIGLSNLSKGILQKIFQSALFQMLGKYSYAIYIFHLTLLILLQPLVTSIKTILSSVNPIFMSYAVFVGICVLSVMLAAVSWRFIEQPLLALKHRFPVPSVNEIAH